MEQPWCSNRLWWKKTNANSKAAIKWNWEKGSSPFDNTGIGPLTERQTNLCGYSKPSHYIYALSLKVSEFISCYFLISRLQNTIVRRDEESSPCSRTQASSCFHSLSNQKIVKMNYFWVSWQQQECRNDEKNKVEQHNKKNNPLLCFLLCFSFPISVYPSITVCPC